MTPDALRAEMRASVPAPFNPDRVADRLIARGMHLRSAPKPDADYYDTVSEKLGRYGHHPEARIDYEIEIDALIGLAYERLTMGGAPDLEERIRKAMEFRTMQTPGELRWLNQVFCGAREIYTVKPAWVNWPEELLANYVPTVASIDSMAPHAPATTSERDEAALGGNRDYLWACVPVFLLGMVIGGVL